MDRLELEEAKKYWKEGRRCEYSEECWGEEAEGEMPDYCPYLYCYIDTMNKLHNNE